MVNLDISNKPKCVILSNTGKIQESMSGPQIICCGAQIILLSKEGEALLNCTPSLLSGSHSNEERAQIAFSAVNGLCFLHSQKIFLGNNLAPDKILIIKEKEKIHSIFSSESPALRSDSSLARREDLQHLSNLLVSIWSMDANMEDLNHDQQNLVLKLREQTSEVNLVDEIVRDVAFWSPAKIMEFFESVSDILELKQKAHRTALEEDGCLVVGTSWLQKLDPVLGAKVENDSRKRRNYNWRSVVDLLRVMRNLKCHYFNLTPEIRQCLGPYEDLGQKWTSLFPHLLSHVHESMNTFHKDKTCSIIKRFY